MRRIRLLPLVIFSAVLMLSLRLGDVWQGLSRSEAQAAAQGQAPTPLTPQGKAEPAKPQDAKTPETKTAAKSDSKTETKPDAKAQAAKPGDKNLAPLPLPTANDPAGQGSAFDPASFSPAEIEVLQRLAARRDEIEARGREMDMREALVKAAEARIDKKVGEMKAMQNTIENLLRKYDEQEDNKMKSLVKIYETMKPSDAARIFEQLDMPILLSVLERMKEAKAAPIIAAMDPGKAKTVTSELAQRRQLPQPNSGVGG